MPILASFMYVSESKAKKFMNMAIVNPIPVKTAIPYIWIQFDPVGNLAYPNFINKKVVKKTPICFPKKRPVIIPRGIGLVRDANDTSPK